MSTGEKMQDLDLFHPDRMASRILGMGDVVSLVERAEQLYTEEQHRSLSQKIKKNQFNLNDLVHQIQQIKKMGNIKDILSMIPGIGKLIEDISLEEEDLFQHAEVIIQSMTPEERKQPAIIDRKRKERIAQGSGTAIQEVNQLLKNFDMLCKTMRKMENEERRLNLFGAPKKLKKLRKR